MALFFSSFFSLRDDYKWILKFFQDDNLSLLIVNFLSVFLFVLVSFFPAVSASLFFILIFP